LNKVNNEGYSINQALKDLGFGGGYGDPKALLEGYINSLRREIQNEVANISYTPISIGYIGGGGSSSGGGSSQADE